MICRPHNQPQVGQDLDATICWLTEQATLRPGNRYTLKHTTRSVKAVVKSLQYRLEINTLHRDDDATELTLNEIGRIRCERSRRSSSTSTAATARRAASS